jgi:hypothetical protein
MVAGKGSIQALNNRLRLCAQRDARCAYGPDRRTCNIEGNPRANSINCSMAAFPCVSVRRRFFSSSCYTLHIIAMGIPLLSDAQLGRPRQISMSMLSIDGNSNEFHESRSLGDFRVPWVCELALDRCHLVQRPAHGNTAWLVTLQSLNLPVVGFRSALSLCITGDSQRFSGRSGRASAYLGSAQRSHQAIPESLTAGLPPRDGAV